MKKRPISIFDISMYLGAVEIVCYLGSLLFPVIANTAMFIIIAVVILLFIYLIIYFPSHKLPGVSRYNPFNIIEFHVGTSCKRNINLLGQYFVETLLISKEKEKDLMFTTWFFKASTIKYVFGDTAIIFTPSIPEMINGTKSKFKYRDFGRFIKKLCGKGPKVKPRSKPLITCVIKHEKINDELINTVKSHFKI